MILTSLYALASAIGFVVDLANHQWIPMFCVAVSSACAYRGGNDLHWVFRDRSFNNKFGRAIIAILVIAFAFYIANYPVHLVYASVPGRLWVLLGVIIGIVTQIGVNDRPNDATPRKRSSNGWRK